MNYLSIDELLVIDKRILHTKLKREFFCFCFFKNTYSCWHQMTVLTVIQGLEIISWTQQWQKVTGFCLSLFATGKNLSLFACGKKWWESSFNSIVNMIDSHRVTAQSMQPPIAVTELIMQLPHLVFTDTSRSFMTVSQQWPAVTKWCWTLWWNIDT